MAETVCAWLSSRRRHAQPEQPAAASVREMDEVDSDEVDGLLRLFAEKVGQDADTAELDLAKSALTLVKHETEHRLHLPRDVIAAGLEEMRAGIHPWEAGVSAPEALARLMTIHLDESLATSPRHETGWWSYRSGCFDPVPPWEARREP